MSTRRRWRWAWWVLAMAACDDDATTTPGDVNGGAPDPEPRDACAVRYPHGVDPVAATPLRGGFVRMPALEAALAGAPSIPYHDVPTEPTWGLFADFDGDGRTDLIFNDGRDFCAASSFTAGSWLLTQDASGRLRAPARLPDVANCRLAADLDGDGRVDAVCYSSGMGWVVRWNDGAGGADGAPTPLVREDLIMAIAAWDLDADGVLDLVLSGWNVPSHAMHGLGRRAYEDVSAAWGLGDRGSTWSTGFVDFDGDGVREVYVVEDGSTARNRVLRDRRAAGATSPRFERYSPSPGGCDRGGWFAEGPDTPMGFALGDTDRDGRFEVVLAVAPRVRVLSPRASQPSQWAEVFDPLQLVSGQSTSGSFLVPWSPALWDMDHDGALDLVVPNGDDVGFARMPNRGRSALRVARGGPRGTLRDVSDAVGVSEPGQLANVQLGDLDGDGDLDLVVGCFGAPPRVYENRIETTSRHVLLSLRGTVSNPEGLGATVRATTPRQTLPVGDRWAPWGTARPDLDVALGADPSADRLDITWPSGCAQTVMGPFTGRTLTVTEPAWMTLTPPSRHVTAGGGATVTVRVTPSLLGRAPTPTAVDIADVAGRAQWVGPATVTDTGDVVRVLRADATSGDVVLRVRVDGVELPAHPRVWFDAPTP